MRVSKYVCVWPLILKLVSVTAQKDSSPRNCANGCSGHGKCDTTTTLCSCNYGYSSSDCSKRMCPTGIAWSDYATANNVAHADKTECSNQGHCNRSTGECKCRTGFDGLACDRLMCPYSSSNGVCSGHGTCLSMREAAAQFDGKKLLNEGVTYGSSSIVAWDADKIYGCVCDEGYDGYDCNSRVCPKGDDPLTAGVNEIQTITCTCSATCSGSFKLLFNNEVTVALQNTDTPATLQTALVNLVGIRGITVTGGVSICTAAGQATSVTFTSNPGNLPLLRIKSSTLATTGATATITVVEATAGTKENVVCSNRGVCSTSTGICTCATNAAASDGAGGSGTYDDCGFNNGISACPDAASGTACSGRGTCSGNPTYTCSCNSGYSGHACELVTCPTGKAWFDEATATDTAHAASTTCSNKGTCATSTGLCACDSLFGGTACEQMTCYDQTQPSSSQCSGKGSCLSMTALAAASTYGGNGDVVGYTYSQWDATQMYGCACNTYHYHGPLRWDISDAKNYDCSKWNCPYGDDPELGTGQVHEIQQFTCAATAGTWYFKFRGKTSKAIAWNADADTVRYALRRVNTVLDATVTFSSGTSACSAAGVAITVEFSQTDGALPLFSVITSGFLTLNGANVAAAPTVTRTQTGTYDAVECSNRGNCDEDTGRCWCYQGYSGSNGSGLGGTRAECGFKSTDTENSDPAAFKAFTSDETQTWILLGYEGSGKDSKIVLKGTGGGGLPELWTKMSETEILYGALKVHGIDDRGTVKSTRTKVVAFVHVGPGVAVMRKAGAASHKGAVMAFLNTANFSMDCQGKDGFSDKEIASKLIATGGAHKPNSYDFGGGLVNDFSFYESASAVDKGGK